MCGVGVEGSVGRVVLFVVVVARVWWRASAMDGDGGSLFVFPGRGWWD